MSRIPGSTGQAGALHLRRPPTAIPNSAVSSRGPGSIWPYGRVGQGPVMDGTAASVLHLADASSIGVHDVDRQDADRFTSGSSPWGAAERDTPWLDVHGDGYWIRCYRTGHNSFEWFMALRSGQSYESTQPTSIRADIVPDQAIFPDAILDAFSEIEIAARRLEHAEAGLEIETGLGPAHRDPFETRETDILHFPRTLPPSTDTERVPHVLRLVPNSRPTRKKRRFLPRRPANIFQGSDPWLDFEIDGRSVLVAGAEGRRNPVGHRLMPDVFAGQP